MGSALHLQPDGSYLQLPEGGTVLDTLRALGGYSVLLGALQVGGWGGAGCGGGGDGGCGELLQGRLCQGGHQPVAVLH